MLISIKPDVGIILVIVAIENRTALIAPTLFSNPLTLIFDIFVKVFATLLKHIVATLKTIDVRNNCLDLPDKFSKTAKAASNALIAIILFLTSDSFIFAISSIHS